MGTLEIISKKRDKIELNETEINSMIQKFTSGSIPDYQMSAFAMAVYLNGMSKAETSFLTKAMLESGKRLKWSSDKIFVDKHSSGGVGDKVSIILAPILAAGGLSVPMIAGRGLAHTGGTLDKLESIPGFSVDLSIKQFQKQVNAIGLAIISQGPEIVPADKKLYALRDVTGTVASLPLITSSIMSKKIAEGISTLLIDIKCGNAAFMKAEEDAIELAKSLIQTGKQFGVKVEAVISSMDQPLGYAIGNALEIKECIDVFKGKGPPDLIDLTHYQVGRLFYAGKKVKSLAEGIQNSIDLIKSGKALDFFSKMLDWQGADSKIIDNPNRLPHAELIIDIYSDRDAYISKINTQKIGMLCVDLGAGRRLMTDQIRFANGIELFSKIGQAIYSGELIAKIHCNKNVDQTDLKRKFLNLIEFSDHEVKTDRLLRAFIDSTGEVHQTNTF